MKKEIILIAPTGQRNPKSEQFAGLANMLAETSKKAVINIIASPHIDLGNTADSVKETLTRAGFPNVTVRGNSDLSRPLSDPKRIEGSITETTADIYIVLPTQASYQSIQESPFARKVKEFNPAA